MRWKGRVPMKVYSRKTLLAAMMAGGLALYLLQTFDSWTDLFWIGLLGYLMIQGLRVSFSKEAFEDDQKRGTLGRRVRQRMFRRCGRLAVPVSYLIQFSPIFLLLFMGVVIRLCPTRQAGQAAVLILAALSVVDAVVVAVWFRRYMKLEESSGTGVKPDS